MSFIYGQSKIGIEGRSLYVSPKPYPVPFPAYDYGSNVIKLGGHFIDIGKLPATVFPWQMLIGMPLGILLIFVLMFPLVTIGFGFLSGDIISSLEDAPDHLAFSFTIGGPGALLVFVLIGNTIFSSIKKNAEYVPVRFNRQRRQVSFVPEGRFDPVVVDWEDMKVWVGDYATASQYGVLKHHSLGFSFNDKVSGEEFGLELSSTGLPMALGSWELIRSFMDYEIDSFNDARDQDSFGPNGSAGVEGVSFFKAKRRQLHSRLGNHEVSFFYFIGWYLYHVFTLWTLPNRLAEWEANEVRRLKQDKIPEEMERWSMPLPESSWRRPSRKFLEESNQVRSIFSSNSGLSMDESFEAVHQQMSQRIQQG